MPTPAYSCLVSNEPTIERRLLGLAVRGIREAKNVKLDVLATDAGLNYGFLSRLERGERGASPETIDKLAAALKVPVDAISYETPVYITRGAA